ncbi:response regulator [Thalassolituus sp. LLYu03]|uniref:response regulator n=1 Tax=Thalassolituus sp. LLYu03 TaxID=3421656 RepID=UPI003D2CD559
MALHTAAVALLLAMLISVYSINDRIDTLQKDYLQQRNSLIAATLPAFNLATFNYNSRLNQHLADGLARHPQIASVVVLDSDGSIQARATAPAECKPDELDLFLFGEPAIDVRLLEYSDTHLGKLVVEADICDMTSGFYRSVSHNVLFIILTTTIVALFVFTSFYWRITRPLTRLSQQIGELTPDNIEVAELEQFSSERQDELGDVIAGTQRLLSLLKDHIVERKRSASLISDYSAKLETLIHKRSDALSSMRRRLSAQTPDDERQSQIPLLTVVLPQTQELLQAIRPQLTDADQAQIGRLLTLLTRLSVIEQPEQTALVELESLSQERFELCPSGLRLRLEITDSILVAPKRFALLLDNLFSIAAQSMPDELSLTIRRHQEGLEAVLTGEHFALPCSALNAVIEHQFQLAPGTLAAVTRALGGRMEIDKPESGPLRVVVVIPVLWLSERLTPLRDYLRHTKVRVSMTNDLLTHQVIRWLSDWEITASTQGQEGAATLLLTDELHEGLPGQQLLLHTTSPDQVYRREDLLRDLQQLIPTPQPKSRSAQVLLVDDNTINRMLCQRFLRNLGITPDAVDNGLQALEQAQRKHYDVILMDCQMPVMDGIEATRQIRRHSLNMKTPIIALTGLTGENERQNCLTAGMNDFIGKPFTQDQIQATMIQWLDGFPLTPPAPTNGE